MQSVAFRISECNIKQIAKREDSMIDEAIRSTIFDIIDNNTYMQTLGMELVSLDEGYAKGRMKMSKMIENPYGGAHGGALYSLADTISGFAACTYGCYVCTVSGNMNYLLPGVNTEYIYCEAKVVRQGMHLAVYDVEITDDFDKVLQTGTFTFYVMNEPKQ